MNTYTVKIGGVATFTGSLGEALEVIAASVDKPKLPVGKAKIEAAEVGTVFKVGSRVKGGGSATIVVESKTAIEIKPIGLTTKEFDVIQTAMINDEFIAQEIKPVPTAKAAVVAFTKKGTPVGVSKDCWDYVTSQVATYDTVNVTVVKKTDKRFEVTVEDNVIWYTVKEQNAQLIADAITTVYKTK